jgi:hypothetical protein
MNCMITRGGVGEGVGWRRVGAMWQALLLSRRGEAF